MAVVNGIQMSEENSENEFKRSRQNAGEKQLNITHGSMVASNFANILQRARFYHSNAMQTVLNNDLLWTFPLMDRYYRDTSHSAPFSDEQKTSTETLCVRQKLR